MTVYHWISIGLGGIGYLVYSWPVYCIAVALTFAVGYWALTKESRGKPSRARFLSSLQPPGQLPGAEENCAFCWDSNTQSLQFPCRHIFCKTCINEICEHFSTCPVCRGDLFYRATFKSILRQLCLASLVMWLALDIIMIVSGAFTSNDGTLNPYELLSEMIHLCLPAFVGLLYGICLTLMEDDILTQVGRIYIIISCSSYNIAFVVQMQSWYLEYMGKTL